MSLAKEWYVAELIVEFRVQDEADNVVHIDLNLLHASSAQEAYQKAVRLGELSNGTHLNDEGKIVTVRFRGLRELHVVLDPLQDGTLLLYEEMEAVPEQEIIQMITAKRDLNAFLD